jgi:hypothetical protein
VRAARPAAALVRQDRRRLAWTLSGRFDSRLTSTLTWT